MAVHGLLVDALSRRGAKIVTVILALALVLGGLGAAAYYLWPEPAPKPPPAATITEVEARNFIAGDDFKRLSVDQRIAWVEEYMQKRSEMGPPTSQDFRDSWEKMDDQTRRRFHENMQAVMQERMNREVDTYHKLPPSERTAFLDKRIDEMRGAMESCLLYTSPSPRDS